jgi:hypothetical protein
MGAMAGGKESTCRERGVSRGPGGGWFEMTGWPYRAFGVFAPGGAIGIWLSYTVHVLYQAVEYPADANDGSTTLGVYVLEKR